MNWILMENFSDTNPDDSNDEISIIFRVSNEIVKRAERTTSILLLKTGSIIEADKPVEDQLYSLRFRLFFFF